MHRISYIHLFQNNGFNDLVDVGFNAWTHFKICFDTWRWNILTFSINMGYIPHCRCKKILNCLYTLASRHALDALCTNLLPRGLPPQMTWCLTWALGSKLVLCWHLAHRLRDVMLLGFWASSLIFKKKRFFTLLTNLRALVASKTNFLFTQTYKNGTNS
jgi:hypothetical protein